VNTLRNRLENFSYKNQKIPGSLIQGIENYLSSGILPGDFLKSVISNNLLNTYLYADENNIKVIAVCIIFFYNEAPPNSWGSKEKMQAWQRLYHYE